MQQLIDLYKNSKNLHHAYFFVAHKMDEAVSKLKHFLENIVGLKTSGNPDFWHGQYKTFTIDHARIISEAQERKSFNSNEISTWKPNFQVEKIFIIQAEVMTEEAQNALLKVFEEPTASTHFFIISPQDILLPTLRSRMQVIQCESVKEINLILNLKLKDRLLKVKEITDAISNEEKTKQDAIVLLNQIESELYAKGTEESAKSLKICQKTRQALYDRGAPIKIILENLMLSV